MKSNYKLSRIVKTLSLFILCLVLVCSVPVYATQENPSAGEYGLRLQLADDAALDPEEFPECILMLQELSTEKYLIAEYDSEQNYYRVTGLTAEKEKATGFTFVAHGDDQAVLLISGLPEGRYSLSTSKVPNGRQPLASTIISLSSNRAEIDGRQENYLEGTKTLAANFYIFWGYELPGDPYHGFPSEIITGLSIVLVVTALIVFYFVLRKKD